ncbi:MAG: sensor histidine kinase [bacterium]
MKITIAKIVKPLQTVKKSLAFKLILCIGFILILCLKLFFCLENSSDRRMMMKQMKEEAYRLSDIIKRSTYYDMLRARSNEVQEVLKTIGAQEDVVKVRIIKQDLIMISSNVEEVGMKIDKKGECCSGCHKIGSDEIVNLDRYRFFETEEGIPLLGFVNPIYNTKECQSCHGRDKKVLGILDIVLSIEKVQQAIKANRKRSFIFMLLFFILISLFIGLFILKFVNKPIKQLTYGTKRITDGDLEYHIPSPTEDEIGELAKSFNRMTDDLKTYEGQLLHAKDYIDNIIKSMIDTLIVLDPDGKIKTVNTATLRVLKYEREEDLIGQPVQCIFTKNTPFFKDKNFKRFIKKGLIRNYDMSYKRKDGVTIPINLSASVMRSKGGQILAIVCVGRDMREIQKLINDLKKANRYLKATQLQLIQSSRLASMGVLAASVAHEINNPINIIINYAEFLEDELQPNSEMATYTKSILRECQRITDIVRNLLSFSRSDKQDYSQCMIQDIINRSIAFMELYCAKDGITIKTSYDPRLPKLKAKSSQLEQVFINLLLNARDALNEKYPRKHDNKVISIKVACIEKDGMSFMRIVFDDNGKGIDENNLDKIFDPFFTTKKAGKGTGLGLSIISRIISDHHGYLEVRSQKGLKTSFIIELPMESSLVESVA